MMRFGIKLSVLVLAIFMVLGPSYHAVSQEVLENKTETEELDFANGLFSRGMYDMAISGYADFLKKYPETKYKEVANFRMAECYFLGGKYDEAAGRFDTFLKEYPQGEFASKALLREGQVFYYKGDVKRAGEVLGEVLSKYASSKESAGAKYYLGGVAFKQGDYSTSMNRLNEVLSVPDSEYAPFAYVSIGDIYIEQKKYDKAAEAYTKAVELKPDQDFKDQTTFRAATAYQRAGDPVNAEKFYRQITDSPQTSKMYDHAVIGLISVMSDRKDYAGITQAVPTLIGRVKDPAVVAQAKFAVGNAYFHMDRFAEAGKVYAENYAENPDTEFANKSRINECWVLLKAGEYDKCLAKIDENVAKAGPGSTMADEALYLKARTYTAAGRKEEAAAAYEKILAEGKTDDMKKEALYELGWMYEAQGASDKAIESFRAFAEKYPSDERAQAVLLKVAQEYFKLKDYDKAEKEYGDFLEKYKSSPLRENVLYQNARVASEKGDFAGAVALFQSFIKEYPNSKGVDAARYGMGYAYRGLKEWDNAIAAYSEIVLKGKGEFYDPALESQAYCYFQKGERGKAAEAYTKLIADDPAYRLPQGVYEWTAEFYLEGDSKKALGVMQALYKAYPDVVSSGKAAYLEGACYIKQGESAKAIELLKKAIDMKPEAPYLGLAYIALGRAYHSLGGNGDNTRAIEAFTKAIEGNEDNFAGATARFETAAVYVSMGNYAEAAKQYMMVAILYDDVDLCSRALYEAGAAFKKSGDKEKSADAFAELARRYPGSEMAAKAEKETGTVSK